MSFTEQFIIGPFVYIFDAFIRRTKLMATLNEITTMVDEVSTAIDTIDTGLDEVATLIADLKAGQVSQEQIDALAAKVESLKSKSSSVVAETEGLKA